MEKMRTSLSICMLVFFSANVLTYKMDSPKKKPTFNRRVFVSDYIKQ